MILVICNIISAYLGIGMCLYGFVFAVMATLWAKTHNITTWDAIKQHFKKDACVYLLVDLMLLWPISIVVFVVSLIKTWNRIKAGEFITVCREVEEGEDVF